MNYTHDIGWDNPSTGLRCIGTQLMMLNYLWNQANDSGGELWPTMFLDGVDVYDRYFKRGGKPDGELMAAPCPGLPNDFADHGRHAAAFHKTIHWSDEWAERCDRKIAEFRHPQVGLSIRETDKYDDVSLATPTFILERVIGMHRDNVFVTSDCEMSLKELKRLPNVVIPNRPRSKTLFPLHRHRKNPAFPEQSYDAEEHLEGLLTDMYILSKMKIVYYGVWHGVLAVAMLFGPGCRSYAIADMLGEDVKRTLQYCLRRERFLWACFDRPVAGIQYP